MTDYWIKEVERATQEEGEWVKKAREVIKRYVDRRGEQHEDKTRFNILWSNTETMRPALISSVPQPEIRPRYRKKDPVARVAAKILERAIRFSLDQYDFVKFGKRTVQDYLLPGRGVARVKYRPVFEKKEAKVPLTMSEEAGEVVFRSKNKSFSAEDVDFDDDGPFAMEQREEVVFEDVFGERVPWQWFRMEPADEWKNVNWVAFGAPYSRDEGYNKWGKKFYQATEEARRSGDKEKANEGKVIVWEIWDKRTRKQLFVAKGLDKPLEKNDDPLELVDFFPMPEPIYIVEDNDTMVPTPEFCLWQDQADELDLLSERIRKITDAIKARGAYAGEKQAELSDILDSDDNQLVPIADWMAFIDKGGLDGLISWVPIEQFAKVLQILEQERAIKIQEIYELTGVSDIMRGATDPRETAKAQNLKANFGNKRLLTKQDTVQRFFRDIYRIKAEIISEQFDSETLRAMVGLEGQNEIFDAAVQMIRSDVNRAFNVDVETDTTIAIDEEREKQGLAEAMQATSAFVGSMFPLVQMGAIPNQVAFEILRDYFRKFKFGRRLDDLLDEFQQQQPPNQEAQQQQQEQQAEMQKMKAEMEAFQQKTQIELQALQQKLQLEIQGEQQKLAMDQQEAQQDLTQDEQKHDQEMRQDAEMHSAKVANTKELGEAQIDVKRRQAQVNQSKVQE
jgi:hypothetical protein